MWMKYRIMWRSGYGQWEWNLLSYNQLELDACKLLADDVVIGINDENYWNEGFRKVEYEIHEKAPDEVIDKKIDQAESRLHHIKTRLNNLREMKKR